MKLMAIAGTLVLAATLVAAPLEAGWHRGALQSGAGVQDHNPWHRGTLQDVQDHNPWHRGTLQDVQDHNPWHRGTLQDVQDHNPWHRGTLQDVQTQNHWYPGALQSDAGVQAQNPLSLEEESTLLFMREEEKMARDVYITLFDLWEHPVFNISAAEQGHMYAMKNQIDRYGLVDPVTDDTVGVFDNEELGARYLDLVDMGGKSLEMALRAGALIEEIDILDLENAIAESTHDDVTWAYGNLLRGSRNHLRVFVDQLESMGIVYEAQEMDQARFDEIVDSPMERGCRVGCKGRGGYGFWRFRNNPIGD